MKNIISAVLRLIVVVCAVWGISLCAFDPSAFMGGKSVWLYFTIQSNVWVAVCLLIGLVYKFLRKEPGRWYGVLQLVTTISIMLTGIVFCFVLAPTIEGDIWSISDICTHLVVPIASVLDYLISARSLHLRYSDVAYVLIPPVYYLAFSSVGYVLNWPFAPGKNYPYFFLNWGSPAGAFGFTEESPWMGVMWYVVIMLVSLSIVGVGMIAYNKLLKK